MLLGRVGAALMGRADVQTLAPLESVGSTRPLRDALTGLGVRR